MDHARRSPLTSHGQVKSDEADTKSYLCIPTTGEFYGTDEANAKKPVSSHFIWSD
jgi:hypothetical protein